MPTLLDRAISDTELGRRAAGRRKLLRFLREHPQDTYAWLWLARSEEQPARRRACLKRVLELDPDHLVAQQELAALQSPFAWLYSDGEPEVDSAYVQRLLRARRRLYLPAPVWRALTVAAVIGLVFLGVLSVSTDALWYAESPRATTLLVPPDPTASPTPTVPHTRTPAATPSVPATAAPTVSPTRGAEPEHLVQNRSVTPLPRQGAEAGNAEILRERIGAAHGGLGGQALGIEAVWIAPPGGDAAGSVVRVQVSAAGAALLAEASAEELLAYARGLLRDVVRHYGGAECEVLVHDQALLRTLPDECQGSARYLVEWSALRRLWTVRTLYVRAAYVGGQERIQVWLSPPATR